MQHGNQTRWAKGALTLALMVSAGSAASAQSWVYRHSEPGNDDEQPTTSLYAPDGSIVVAGTTGTGGGMDFLVIKVDPAGALVWRTRLDGGGMGQDILHGAAVDPGGDVLVTGRSPLTGSSDFYTARLRGTDGAVLWTARADGAAKSIDQANAVAIGPSGEVAVTGLSYGSNSGQDYLTVLYDANGGELWRKVYRGPGPFLFDHDSGESVAIDANGDVFVTGRSNDTGGIEDYYTIKYRGSDGATLWSRRYTGAGANDVAYRVVVDGAGDVLVCGESFQSGYRLATLKYDGAGGAVQWTALDSAVGRIQFRDLELDSGGDWYVTASADPDGNQSNVNEDVYVARRSQADGSLVWSRTYGGRNFNQYEVPSDLALAPDGDVVVAGAQIVLGSITDVLYLRLRGSDGRILANALYDAPNADADGGNGIHVAPTGEVFVAGVSQGGQTQKDYLVLSYTDDNLVLSPNRSQVRAGDALQLGVSLGSPSAPVLLAVVGVNGAPWFQLVDLGQLSALGLYRLDVNVPSGLSGLEVDFQGFSVARSGRPGPTNRRTIRFQ